ncbi:DUF547 domain-containing protein [Marinobacter sp. V034]|uniref:DUF547 domain-containing protein n=1 Tax=Marinobacter sp. V034 TaxID=3459610 RepID=UPI004043AE0B
MTSAIGTTLTAVALMILSIGAAGATSFDHSHGRWNGLLQAHVSYIEDGIASTVDYDGFAKDEKALDRYLGSLSAVSLQTLDGWPEEQRLAFLINAYNAFTVKLILNHYPGLESIRDIGNIFQSPWSRSFFTLLGKERSLDELEHEMIREWFNEPRIHMAVNCASVGCPALAASAYTGDSLDAQLDKAVERFLSDSTRNRYLSVTNRYEVSSIFDWYGDDWNRDSGYPGGVRAFLNEHIGLMAQAKVPDKATLNKAEIKFLDYDWALNTQEYSRE